MFKKTIFKNGLRVVTVPQKGTQSATVLVLVGTGSKYENKQNNGVSHFLEHMFFKGTKKRPDKLAVAEALDKVGGVFNAFTGQDYTGYFAKVEASHFKLALDWVSDIFLNSVLPREEMRKERRVIIEEINMIHDSPITQVQDLWLKVLYGDQPAGWDITGSKENVLKMKKEDLLDYMNSQYVAENTFVCLAGKNNQDSALKEAKKHFSKIRATSPFIKPRVVEKQKEPDLLLENRKTDQTHLCLGVRGYNLFHPLRYAQEVLGVILGGMMSSRLFMEVRERLGLAYHISVDVSSDPDTGFLVAQAGVDNKNVLKAVSAVLKEYRKISQKRVPAPELKKAKENIKGKTALSLESSSALASFYADQELLEKRILTPNQIFRKIDQVSAAEIRKVAKDIFQSQKLNLALIGPGQDQKELKSLLRI